MKKAIKSILAISLILTVFSCSKDDNNPEPTPTPTPTPTPASKTLQIRVKVQNYDWATSTYTDFYLENVDVVIGNASIGSPNIDNSKAVFNMFTQNFGTGYYATKKTDQNGIVTFDQGTELNFLGTYACIIGVKDVFTDAYEGGYNFIFDKSTEQPMVELTLKPKSYLLLKKYSNWTLTNVVLDGNNVDITSNCNNDDYMNFSYYNSSYYIQGVYNDGTNSCSGFPATLPHITLTENNTLSGIYDSSTSIFNLVNSSVVYGSNTFNNNTTYFGNSGAFDTEFKIVNNNTIEIKHTDIATSKIMIRTFVGS